MTVRDVQRYFGFESPRAIYKWESGASLPHLDNLLALSVLLETSIDSLIVTIPTDTAAKINDEPTGSFFLPFLRLFRACSSFIFVPEGPDRIIAARPFCSL